MGIATAAQFQQCTAGGASVPRSYEHHQDQSDPDKQRNNQNAEPQFSAGHGPAPCRSRSAGNIEFYHRLRRFARGNA